MGQILLDLDCLLCPLAVFPGSDRSGKGLARGLHGSPRQLFLVTEMQAIDLGASI